LQVKPHEVPLQVALAFAGGVQAEQELGPHVDGLVFCAHCPLQRCSPESQLQAFPLGMQLPVHSFIPVGQLGWQVVPSQVALPPVGA
jgi:hypothetical protein